MAKHPITDRPPIGTEQERTAALCYLAAACHMKRAQAIVASFGKAEMTMQMLLADNPDDLALIGKMSGRMGWRCCGRSSAWRGPGPVLPGGPAE